MRVELFDFELPPERIALRPAVPRDSARLMIVDRNGGRSHARLSALPDFLAAGDVLVVNDSKVIRARLRGTRGARLGTPSKGANIEVTLHKRLSPERFSAFAKPAKRLRAGDHVRFGGKLEASIAARAGGEVELIFNLAGKDLDIAIGELGEMPLPPYIVSKRPPDRQDEEDYQTIFAAKDGSVAAPTAGLHFTPKLLDRLKRAEISIARITLHVGAGTFLPVTAGDTDNHKMHSEHAAISEDTATRLNAARRMGGRIVAVGTTALRTLESAADSNGNIRPLAGETDIFITPGYAFRAVDVLLTNFHLPRSTLFMLVAAFSGLEEMRTAYAEAIAEKYRFYSYGDACLLFRPLT
jgi:S-adenosylmethionine:tRNA ribosyltransferase-isomerase